MTEDDFLSAVADGIMAGTLEHQITDLLKKSDLNKEKQLAVLSEVAEKIMVRST